MIKKFLATVVLFLCIPSCAFSINPLKWFKKKAESRVVTIVNDIPGLIDVFPEETKELEESIYYTVEVNGISVEGNEIVSIPIYNNQCTISVKSKKRFHDHLNKVPAKIKKVIGWATAWLDTYYSFVCMVNEKVDIVNVAPLVLYVCQELKAQKPYSISYKKPFGIQIWLRELVECN